MLASTGRAENHGVFVEVGRDSALSLLGKTTGFEAHGARAELTIIDNGFGELNFWTLHRVFLLFVAYLRHVGGGHDPVWVRPCEEQERV